MTQVTKILVANRGEIAVRIMRTATEMGIATVAVYADSDFDSMHLRFADEAYALHGSSPSDTYLNQTKLLEIAQRAGADALHPGYGFLAENVEFAMRVIDAGLTWIGPTPHSMSLLGDKSTARGIAKKVGAPLIPGSQESVRSADDIHTFADKHGFPLIIKAVHGGGGRGMRVVRASDEVSEQLRSAQQEARLAFGSDTCLVEVFLDQPRHLEVQILADTHGNISVVGTRDCSLQRRNQKLVEEAPAPFISAEIEDRICKGAVSICREAGYVGAGTVEFLLDSRGNITFLEVNTRLQVEHSVTEAVTGVDLVREQIKIARGETLTLPPQVPISGHAIEFRVNAEDPALGFLPSPGALDTLVFPSGPGIRVDAGYAKGDIIEGQFDSLLAKIVVWNDTREAAFARARRALSEFNVAGVATVIPFHRAVLEDPAFIADSADDFGIHTHWIEEECDFLIEVANKASSATYEVRRLTIELDGQQHRLGLSQEALTLFSGGLNPSGTIANARDPHTGEHTVSEQVTNVVHRTRVNAPVTAVLASWQVGEGEHVEEGTVIALMEAMKMEVPITAERSGPVWPEVESGAAVHAGDLLGWIGPHD